MVGSIVSFSAMAVAGREISRDLDTFEIMFYRSALGVVIIFGAVAVLRKWAELRTDRPREHLLRNVFHFAGQNLWFYAVSVIPLAQVFSLEFTTPIWVILLSPLLLGERLTFTRAIAATMGFCGVLLVARPGTMGLSPGVLAALGSAVFFALTALYTRRLTRSSSVLCIMFYLTTIQLFLGLGTAGYDGDIAWPPTHSLPWLAVIGTAGLVAHFCLTKALSIAPAAIVSPIDFARLPTIAVVGMLVYAEPLDINVLFGAIIIFVGNYINILSETRSGKKAATPEFDNPR